MKNKLGIIGSMDIEVETLKEALTDSKTTRVAEMEFYEGNLGNKEVIVVKSGIGKVNSARCVQILCDKFGVSAVVNTGIGGGIGDGLSVGDIVIATELVQHDFDVSGFGYARGYMFSDDKDKPTLYKCNEEMIDLLKAAAKEHLDENKIKTGRIATGDVFVSSTEKKNDIKETFNALVTEMEGASIAQSAAANGIKFVVLRALSDLADGSAVQSYEEFEKETAHLSAEIIKSFAKAF